MSFICSAPSYRKIENRIMTQLAIFLVYKPLPTFLLLETCVNTGGPRLVQFLGPGKNRTIQNLY